MGLLLLFHRGRCHLRITKTTINTAKCESVELRGKAPHPELRLLRVAELCQSRSASFALLLCIHAFCLAGPSPGSKRAPVWLKLKFMRE